MLKGAFDNNNVVDNTGMQTMEDKCYIWGKRMAKFCNFSGILMLLSFLYYGVINLYNGKDSIGGLFVAFLLGGFVWLLWKVFMVKATITIRKWLWGVSENIKM